jgi:hypothetical protein
MAKFEVNLSEAEPEISPVKRIAPLFSEQNDPKQPRVFVKLLKMFTLLVISLAIIAGIGGFFYCQNVKKLPQYSLALLVEAARNNDQETINTLVDSDAVVDDFLPQITDKAVELYGRGMPVEKLQMVSKVVVPLLPAVKDRAREELPNLIREKTQAFDKFPFWAIAIGAERYLDITTENDKAFIKSKLPEREIELTLKRKDDKWQVVAVRDEALAQRIAEKVGQEIIAVAQNKGQNGLKEAGKKLGIDNVKDLLKQAESIFR